ncbi:hypothetical protein LMG31506_05733 [Cupriavidus yeoncheonensis]|uniref:Tyr recombinase domain-containing protein n=1 Tax=Cupriavidus yeoncheonensis TaxID=1462994 RepID=A0A916J117_9BURK|nr:tyrosine-type recombinase/integrase [Cupriavidus yeoncheonensis]CAG2156574.1 hypothetical protein LMG31506_05733 [Cupriavidus yeoncheonensis]
MTALSGPHCPSTLRQLLDTTCVDQAFEHSKFWPERVRRFQVEAAALLDTPLEAFNPSVIEAWRQSSLADGLTPRALNGHVSLLRVALHLAERKHWIPENPARHIRPLTTPPPVAPHEQPPDIHARLEAAIAERNESLRSHRDQTNTERLQRHQPLMPDLRAAPYVNHLEPMYLVMRDSGLTMAECAKLERDDLDLASGLLRRPCKRGGHRQVPLSDLALDVFHRWQPQCAPVTIEPSRRKPSTLIFPGQYPGTPLNISHSWKHLVQCAGVPDLTLFDLRQDFMMRLIKQGASPSDLLYLVGRAPARGWSWDWTNMGALRTLINKASQALRRS